MTATIARHQPAQSSPNGTGGLPRAAQGGRRNRTRIALGLVVIVLCVLATASLFSSANNRAQVLALRHAVPAGHTIASGDLAITRVSVGADVRTTPASALDRIVGRVAAVTLVAGSLLSPDDVSVAARVPSGMAIVGASLKAGQYPVSLAPGDEVRLVEIAGAVCSRRLRRAARSRTSQRARRCAIAGQPGRARGVAPGSHGCGHQDRRRWCRGSPQLGRGRGMTTIAITATKGSPGATTLALALADRMSERVPALLVEADAAGGDIAARCGLALDPGLLTLAASGRRGLDRSSIERHTQLLPCGALVLAGPTSAEQATSALTGVAAALAQTLALETSTVIIDAGRWDPRSPATDLVASASIGCSCFVPPSKESSTRVGNCARYRSTSDA